MAIAVYSCDGLPAFLDIGLDYYYYEDILNCTISRLNRGWSSSTQREVYGEMEIQAGGLDAPSSVDLSP